MSAIAPLVANDGKTTPIAHTFTPIKIDGDTAIFADKSASYAVGFNRLDVTVRPPVMSTPMSKRAYRVSFKLWLPTLEVTSPSTGTGIQPAPTKAYELFAETTFLVPERASKIERTDLFVLHYNLMNLTAVKAAIIDLEGFW